MKYGSVVFDMDGVLLDFEGDGFKWKYDAVRRVLKQHGINTGEMTRDQLNYFIGDRGVKACVKACNERDLDARTIWTEIAEETSKARAVQINKGNFSLFPEVIEVLDQLDGNVKLGVISNAPETALRETVNFFDLKHYFDFFRGIEDFGDLTDRKPHPDHLEFARAELKREPFIYAGDHQTDVEAAINAGMDSVWVNRRNHDMDISPDYTVENLDEMMEIIR